MRAARSASTQSAGALTRKGKRQTSEEREDGKHQWCLFHNLTAHSDVSGRVQHHNKTDGGSANCSTHSRYSAVLSTRNHPPSCNPERHASQLTWWKRLRMRRRSGRLTPRMSQPPRSDTRPLETHLRTPASYLVTSVASLARKLSARPSLSRNGQSGDGDFEAISPAVWHP